MQSTYWLEKVLKMISLYVNVFLCALQRIVIHAMQLNGVIYIKCTAYVLKKCNFMILTIYMFLYV